MSATMFAIGAQRHTKDGQWTGSQQVPTFYLHPNVQGLLTEEDAVRVAQRILGPDHTVTAVRVRVD